MARLFSILSVKRYLKWLRRIAAQSFDGLLKKVTLGLSLTMLPKVSCFARDGLLTIILKASWFARGGWLIEIP